MSATSAIAAEVSTLSWDALGTSVVLRHTGPAQPALRTAVEAELTAIDEVASRFRPDSELRRLSSDHPQPISPRLHEAIALALRAAELTDGAVDPTLGAELIRLGYDRDHSQLTAVDPATSLSPPRILATRTRRPAWAEIELQENPPRVRLPAGVVLDLGATAKALAADRAAAAARRAAEDPPHTGILISLGGDIALAGPPPEEGWAVHVTDDHRDGPDAPGQTITLHTGGLATSSLTTRRWRTGPGPHDAHHHILDPATGREAAPVWRTVSVAAATCADANIASTAAVVLGDRAPQWLERQGLPARLVALDGTARTLGGWPA
jgi:thiamine biosynthesis lipoprotein